MSYIPPWVTGAGTSHYPAHMLPPQHSLSGHTQHSLPPPQHTPLSASHQSHITHPPVSAHSPLASAETHVAHIYQALSPKSLVASLPQHQSQLLNGTKNYEQQLDHNNSIHHHNHSVLSPSQSSPAAAAAAAAVAAAVVTAANLSAQQHSSPSTTPNQPPPATTPSHINNSLDSPYEPQGFHRDNESPPHHKLLSPDLRPHDLTSQLCLPDLALGIPSTSSAAEIKAHRKYVRSLVESRSPGKHPTPEQLSAPVMYTYQGRGRPRKHWTHGTGLPTMIPITHPPMNHSEDDDENKPFKCAVCAKGFKLRSGLQQHERTHSSDRPYVCPDCGKLFRQPTHLHQHMRIHTGEKPYDCTFCDKSFRQRTILNQHLRIHTGEKPYVCMECGKQFRQKAILDQHYRTHLGDKPFACPHPACRKHFREMATLISHMKCHKDVPDPKIVLQQAKKLIKEEHDEYILPDGPSNGINLENLARPPHIGGLQSLVSHSGHVPHGLAGQQPSALVAQQGLLSLGHGQMTSPLGISTNTAQQQDSTNGALQLHRNHLSPDLSARYHTGLIGIENNSLDIRPYPSPGSNGSQKSPHSSLPGHSPPNSAPSTSSTPNGNASSGSSSDGSSNPTNNGQTTSNGTNSSSNTGNTSGGETPTHSLAGSIINQNQSATAMSSGGMMAATTSHMATMANLIPYPHSIFPGASYMVTPHAPDPRQYHQLSSQSSQASVRPAQ